jgi:hypothetical protein
MSDIDPDRTSGPYESIATPHCFGMSEDPSAAPERTRLSLLQQQGLIDTEPATPLSAHLLHGLAYTVGSALNSSPPALEACLMAFTSANKAGLSAGARAWSKHFHRSQPEEVDGDEPEGKRTNSASGWWGTPSGPVAVINEKALLLFWRIMNHATWKNLHWLPHQVLAYEVRVVEGYGMRWSQDCGSHNEEGSELERPWLFRGFVEPMMGHGHGVGWKHQVNSPLEVSCIDKVSSISYY